MKKLLLIQTLLLLVFLASAIKTNAQCPTTAPIISGPTNVCAGTTVNYNLVSAGFGNLIWSISGGGTLLGGSFNPINPQVNWASAGTWRISISTLGCTTTPIGFLDVTVVNSPTIPAPTSIAGPVGVCNGSTTVYSIPVVAGQSPIWFIKQAPGAIPGSGTTPALTPSGNQVSINWTVQASYILYASYTNGTCSGIQASLLINNSSGTSPITINGNGTDQFCLNQSFNFTAYGDPQDTFTWSLPTGGGTITPSGNSALVQWTSAGSFSVAVTATNPCGAPRNTSKPVTVGPAVTLAPGMISKQNAITCLNQTERLSVPAVSGATSYKWTIGLPAGNYYYTTSVPYLDRTFSSNASVTASVIASNGYCDSPPSPIFSFYIGLQPIAITFPSSVCVGAPTTLTVTSAGDMSGYIFSWSVGDGIIIGPSNGSSISVRWDTPGDRGFAVSASTLCGTIYPPPALNFISVQTPSFTMNPISGISTVCLGQYRYSAPVTQSGVTPTWSLTGGGGISYSSPPTIFVNWTTPGNYTLTANATNSCGTFQSQSLSITVANGPKPTVSLINGTNSEPVCVSSLPAIRNYSVPLTAGNSYLWGILNSPASTISSSANSASVTWNQLATNSYVTVTPFTAACSGELTYLSTPVNLNSSVGVLSASVSTLCSNAISPIILSLSSIIGTVTYQVRKKSDGGAWSSWTNIPSASYTETFVGVSPSQALYLEFQAVVQNLSCSPVISNIAPVTIYISPYNTNNSTTSDQIVCSGQTTTITPTSNLVGATFSWTTTVTGSITGAPASGTGNISHTLINTGTTYGTVAYSITPTVNGCTGNPIIVNRLVYPKPVLAPPTPKSICSGQSVSYDLSLTPAGLPSNTTLSWPDPDGIGPATAGSRNEFYTPDIYDNLLNNTTSPINVTYQVTPSWNGCVGSTANVVITVNPKPTMTSPSTTAGCSGLPLSLSLTSNIPSSFLWWASNNLFTSGESLTSKSTSVITDIILLDVGTPQTVTYFAYPTSTIGSCLGATQTISASIGVNQTITFNPLPSKNYGDPAFALTATASSGLPVSFTSSNPAVATISGNTVTIIGGGTTNITASQAGNATYCSPAGVIQTLTVNKINQSITFSPLALKTPSDPAFTLTATASSGLPVSYTSSNTAVATISGNTVTLIGTGTTTITASQAGNANYNPATSIQQSQVVKVNQTINFALLTAKTFGDPTFSLTATASSGLPVSYTSSNTAVATVLGNTVTIVGGGATTITASQGGDVNYYAAPDLPQILTVNKSNQTITFAALPIKTYGNPSFSLTATASSGLATTYTSSNTSVATISGSTLTISGSGNSIITALQTGNTNYNAATGVTQTLTVSKASLSASADNKSRTYGGGNPVFTVSYSGFVNGETSAVIDIPSTASTSATSASNVGSYTIIPAGGSDNNYIITSYINGTLTISKASLTATAYNQTRYYGESNPTLTFYYTGFIGSDGPAVIDSSPVGSTTATSSSPVGSYPIILSGGSDNNYNLSLVNGTLTVTTPPPPPPTCSIKITKTGDLCINGRVRLTSAVTSGGPISSRLWSDGSTSASIYAYEEGSYSVTYYFTSGCSTTTGTYVSLNGTNCTGFRTRADEPLLDVEGDPINVKGSSFYPNPTDKELTVLLEKPATVRTPIRLMDQLGKSLIDTHFEVGESKKRLDTQHLMEGLYLLIISDKRDFPFKQKVLIVHKP